MKHLDEKLETYRYVWEDASGRYVLIQSVKGSQTHETCLVYDLETKRALPEKDDDVSRELKRRLAEKSIPIFPA